MSGQKNGQEHNALREERPDDSQRTGVGAAAQVAGKEAPELRVAVALCAAGAEGHLVAGIQLGNRREKTKRASFPWDAKRRPCRCPPEKSSSGREETPSSRNH